MDQLNELSSLDIRYLLTEFGSIIGARIDNIYQKESNFYLVLHKTLLGKRILKIMLPSFIYITSSREEMPQKPSNFCVLIRKYLKNTRILGFQQIGLERIIIIKFSLKDIEYNLVIELISPGNIILCNSNMKIIYPLEHRIWKDRVVKSGLIYVPPRKDIDITSMSEKDLADMASKSTADCLISFFAKDLGLGGRHAEDICTKMQLDKKDKLSKIDIPLLYFTLKRKLEENGVYLNAQLDTMLTKIDISKNIISREKDIKAKDNKIISIISHQKEIIKNLEVSIEENTKKAEIMYSNYLIINNILTELKEIRKKHSWDDIILKLKNHKVIKGVNPKENKITLEFS